MENIYRQQRLVTRDGAHKKIIQTSGQNKKRFFHQLQVFVALAFDRTSTSHLVDTSNLGVFEWDDVTMDHIKKWRVNGTVVDKQLIMVSYLFELVYDMMISPADNVSLNGGFESCHGVFGED